MLGFGKKICIGIDVGTSSIKMVELTIKGNRPVLTNYAWVDIDDSLAKYESISTYFETVLPEYIKKMLQESKMSGHDVYFSVSSAGGLITLIEFPDIAREDLDQAVKFEAHKYIPVSLDDVVLSWDIINKTSPNELIIKNESSVEGDANSGESAVEVLLVAAPKNKIIKFEQLAKDIGLTLKAIEIESFSLVRSLIGNDQGNFIIVDIGSRVCNIVLVEKGIIKANRNIDAGGKDISRIIAKSMNVSESKADLLKSSGKNFLSSESNVSFPIIDSIVGEISRVLNSYYKEDAKVAVDGIIISGGTSSLLGIDEYFSKTLGIKTTFGNPLGRIEYDKRIEPEIKKIDKRFSVAVGVALNGVDEYLKNKN
jgi:type IV pilus assembly protein PilM